MAPSVMVVHAGLSGAFDKMILQIFSGGTHNHQGIGEAVALPRLKVTRETGASRKRHTARGRLAHGIH